MDDTKIYLGDGVYARFDGFHIVLTTNSDKGAINEIFLDDTVMLALVMYEKKVKGLTE